MQTNRTLVFVLLFLSAAGVSLSGPRNVPQSKSDEKSASGQLSFVRQFSSAQDLKGVSHPVLNKTIDIIAGPKEPTSPAPSVLQAPYAVTTDSTHRIFVTDIGAGVVQVFDFARGEYSLLRGGDHLRSPLGIAADGGNNIYVSDSSLRTILVYDSKGKFIRYLKKNRGRESYFDAPRGIAVNPGTEHIYVCDTPRHMVIMLDKKGHVLATFGKRGGGTASGEFRNPTQVVATGSEIIVLDSGNSRVQILDLRGHFRTEIRLPDVGERAGLAVDHDKNIYVTDPELNHLQVLNHDGKLLYFFGQSGTDAGQFNGISGAWVDAGHCLYVADTKNKRVQLFQIGGPNMNGC
jgi:DNA-binding beta-propeller fold protein YncE